MIIHEQTKYNELMLKPTPPSVRVL